MIRDKIVSRSFYIAQSNMEKKLNLKEYSDNVIRGHFGSIDFKIYLCCGACII